MLGIGEIRLAADVFRAASRVRSNGNSPYWGRTLASDASVGGASGLQLIRISLSALAPSATMPTIPEIAGSSNSGSSHAGAVMAQIAPRIPSGGVPVKCTKQRCARRAGGASRASRRRLPGLVPYVANPAHFQPVSPGRQRPDLAHVWGRDRCGSALTCWFAAENR